MDLNFHKLADRINSHFQLDMEGDHGHAHWARVRAMGLELAAITGADPLVVELFAWIHDSCRLAETGDPDHGMRAADFAAELRGECFEISDTQLALLQEACRGHSKGGTQADITVQTCWDADRLDLARVGYIPDPNRLCTEPARSPERIQRAVDRSNRWCQWRDKRTMRRIRS
jgi:uncharacterized protein